MQLGSASLNRDFNRFLRKMDDRGNNETIYRDFISGHLVVAKYNYFGGQEIRVLFQPPSCEVIQEQVKLNLLVTFKKIPLYKCVFYYYTAKLKNVQICIPNA